MKKIIINSALALTAMLGLMPATGIASTMFSFSGGSGGTVGTNTVGSVVFTTFTFQSAVGGYTAGTTCAVNVLESFSLGVTTYAVNGGGTLGTAACTGTGSTTNPFSNISGAGAFLTIGNEATSPSSFNAATVGAISLYTASTTVTGSTFLSDIGFAPSATVAAAAPGGSMSISVTGNGSGGVVSRNAVFTLNAVPEPSTLLLFGSGMILAGIKGRKKLLRSVDAK